MLLVSTSGSFVRNKITKELDEGSREVTIKFSCTYSERDFDAVFRTFFYDDRAFLQLWYITYNSKTGSENKVERGGEMDDRLMTLTRQIDFNVISALDFYRELFHQHIIAALI